MSLHLATLELRADGTLPSIVDTGAACPSPRRLGGDLLPVAARAGWAAAMPTPTCPARPAAAHRPNAPEAAP